MSVLNVDKNNFELVRTSEKTVLLDLYADWCGPCRMVSPIVEEIAAENPQYLIGKINVDKEPELAQRFNVMSIPTLIVIQNGKVIRQSEGARPKAQIRLLRPPRSPHWQNTSASWIPLHGQIPYTGRSARVSMR